MILNIEYIDIDGVCVAFCFFSLHECFLFLLLLCFLESTPRLLRRLAIILNLSGWRPGGWSLFAIFEIKNTLCLFRFAVFLSSILLYYHIFLRHNLSFASLTVAFFICICDVSSSSPHCMYPRRIFVKVCHLLY